MNTELLKKKILQLAMQGKLVKQDESEGTADELIDKILEEKKQLMAEEKIKKEKLSKIYKNPSDNHYYEKFEDGKEKHLKNLMLLPDKWQYIKMNDVIFYEQPSKYIVELTNYNDTYNTPVLTAGKSFILGYTNETKGIFSKIPAIIFDDFTTESKYVDFNFKVKSSAMKILNCSNLINIKFIYYLLQVINVDTSTHKRHWLSNYEYMIIPIPAKKEQDRIVIKIEELFKKVESINEHYNRINKLTSLLKSKIINMAIKGELTKQLDTDESASKLIENILEEKRKSIKEGKIKKENLSIIYKDSTDNQFYEKFDDGTVNDITEEIPFEIPSNWCWTRIKNLSSIVSKGTTPKGGKNAYLSRGINFLRAENVKASGKVSLENVMYIDEDTHQNFLKRSILEDKDILICIAGTLGRCAVITNEELPANTNQAVCFIRLINKNDLLINFILNALSSFEIQKSLLSQTKVTAIPNLTLEIISNCLIPIPPTSEQKSIIDKLEKVFNIIG